MAHNNFATNKFLLYLIILSLMALFCFFCLKRFLTSLIMFSSITLFSVISDDIGFLVLDKVIALSKGILFLGIGRGIGLDILGLGIGVFDLCCLEN